VELREIENVVNQSGLVRDNVVVPRRDEADNLQLIGYAVTEGTLETEQLLGFMGKKLPDYMIPAIWIQLEAIPLTNNGKVDKKRLPAWDVSTMRTGEYLAPRNELEKTLVGIWQQLLGIERIGVGDNFFSLGGDSIKIIRLVSKLRKEVGREIKVADVYAANTISQLGRLINESQGGQEWRSEEFNAVQTALQVLKTNLLDKFPDAEQIEDIYPMSDIQVGMVYASLLAPDLGIYHDQFVYSIPADIDESAFRKALSLLSDKHEMLRTAFDLDVHAEGMQIVYKKAQGGVTFRDVTQLETGESRRCIQDFIGTQRQIPFKMDKAPLWRADLFRTKDASVFIFQFHHAILDGWSVASLNKELNNLYIALLSDPEVKGLDRLACTYKDFIIARILEKGSITEAEFWKNEMQGYKRLGIFSQEETYVKQIKAYEPGYLNALNRRMKRDGLSPRGLFFAAYLYTLSMLTYEDELTVGVVTNNRPPIEDGDALLGCFLNTIPFRYSVDQQESTWKSYFTQIENKLIDLKQHERSTLLEIKKICDENSGSENPFFDLLFNFTNFHIYDGIDTGLVGSASLGSIQDGALSHESTNTYFEFTVNVDKNDLQVVCFLRRKLKSGKSPDDIIGYFSRVIDCYLHHYEENIDKSMVIGESERRRMLYELNDTAVAFTENGSVIDMFEKNACTIPDNIAVCFGDKKLSYYQLNAAADEIAVTLAGCASIKPNDKIAFLFDPSIEMIATILAIVKLGCVYVPLSPNVAMNRNRFIYEDCEARLLVVQKNIVDKTPEFMSIGTNSPPVIVGYPEPGMEKKRPVYNRSEMAGSLIYAIYTSGSTGMPKGVEIMTTGLMNFVYWCRQEFDLREGTKMGQATNICFDASALEIWPCLITGGELHIASGAIRNDADVMAQWIVRNKIEVTWQTPSIAVSMLRDQQFVKNNRLKVMIAGGDTFNYRPVEDLPFKLYNGYGPTEATVLSTFLEMRAGGSSLAYSIGKPLANIKVLIVDKKCSIMPIGVPGELCIAGPGLARGYLNNDPLTKEKFPSTSLDGFQRIYRTGDLVRWNEHGEIEFLGRLDNQVKVRGFRIELGEIEQQIKQIAGIKENIVIVKETGESKRIIAYFTADREVDPSDVRAHLQQWLPDYMIPSFFMQMHKLPLTDNGKIDRKALPDPDITFIKEYTPPSNELEEELTMIWSEILAVDKEKISIDANFFEVGGDSISILKLNRRVNTRFNCSISVANMFMLPTVRGMRSFIATGEKDLHVISNEIDASIEQTTEMFRIMDDI
jgi:amino acid adenylation domain-containing protein